MIAKDVKLLEKDAVDSNNHLKANIKIAIKEKEPIRELK